MKVLGLLFILVGLWLCFTLIAVFYGVPAIAGGVRRCTSLGGTRRQGWG